MRCLKIYCICAVEYLKIVLLLSLVWQHFNCVVVYSFHTHISQALSLKSLNKPRYHLVQPNPHKFSECNLLNSLFCAMSKV